MLIFVRGAHHVVLLSGRKALIELCLLWVPRPKKILECTMTHQREKHRIYNRSVQKYPYQEEFKDTC